MSLEKIHVEKELLNVFLIRNLTYAAYLEIVDSSRGVTLTVCSTALSGPYPKKRSIHLV